MDVIDGDANLVRAFDLVSKCNSEIEGLTKTLNELFEEELGQLPPNLKFKYQGEPINGCGYDASEYLTTDHAWSFPLKQKFKNRSADPDMYIGYQVSMCGTRIFPDEKAPMLHVFFWEGAIDFDECYVNFPLDEDSTLSIDSSRLLVWGEKTPSNWMERQWTFSIKLTTMNNRQNLLESVVKPALALMEMKPAKEALPDDLPGLVIYPNTVLTMAATA